MYGVDVAVACNVQSVALPTSQCISMANVPFLMFRKAVLPSSL